MKKSNYPLFIFAFLSLCVFFNLSKTFQIAPKQSEVVPKFFEKEKASLEQKMFWSEERDRYEYDMLKDPATGKIPRGVPEQALKAAKKAKEFQLPILSESKAPISLTITPRGPNNLGGRTRALAFDVRNANIILAGGVSGGLFRTTNGGTSWTRVSPTGVIHNVVSLVQDSRTGFEDTWYYGGGESLGNSATIGSFYRGHGIWKSTDNGLTWNALTATQSSLEVFDIVFDYTHRLVIDPTNGNIYAAAGNGVQRSTDGGASWSLVVGSASSANYGDIIVTPTGMCYAAIHGIEANNGVWQSATGASGTWTRIAGTGATPNHANWNAQSAYGRIVLAYAPSNTNLVFALYYNNTTSSCAGTPAPEAELFRWDNSSGAWTDLSANLPDEGGCLDGNDPFAVQGGYDLCVTVKPNDANTVFVGGTNVYRSTDGFTSTTNTTRIGGYASPANYALYTNHHPDIHYLTFAPSDNNTLYTGTDGGVHKADITVTTPVWTSLNNDYTTYQYYHISLNPRNTNDAIIGGAQDNGTTANLSGQSHSAILGGDGCAVGLMDYTSAGSFNAIASTQSGNLYRLTAPNAGFIIRPSGSAGSPFVTYFKVDDDNTNILYYGNGTTMYRTRIASTIAGTTVTGNSATGWEQMTATLTGNIQTIATSRDSTYTGAAYSASDANRVLYIGTTLAKVYRLNDPAFTAAATAPTDITPAALTSGVVSCIAVNPFDDNEILVTVANYGVNSVYHTTNAKAATPTWTVVEGPATGAVALGSARSCIITRIAGVNTYLVGNSTGLFATQLLNGATTVWDRIGSPEINYAVCASMRLRISDNKIALGTHGNGAFLLDLPFSALPVELLSFTANWNGKYTTLNWATASEYGNKGFDIERSTDGVNFSKIAFVRGYGDTQEMKNYEYKDYELVGNTQYYRLKQIDNNNRSKYSDVVQVNIDKFSAEFTISPNPIDDKFQIQFNKTMDSAIKVRLTDAAGKTIFAEMFTNRASAFDISIQKYGLAKGIYFLYVEAQGVGKSVTLFKR